MSVLEFEYIRRVTANPLEDDDDDDDMNDDGDDSFGEDGDEDIMGDGSEITTQLAAAGWQHGVTFCFVLFIVLSLEVGSEIHS